MVANTDNSSSGENSWGFLPANLAKYKNLIKKESIEKVYKKNYKK